MLEQEQLKKVVEGVILAANKPLSEKQIMAVFSKEEKPSLNQLRQAIYDIQQACESCGYTLVELASGYQFQVKSELAVFIARTKEEKPQKYSKAFLETLALIAYKQPITRGEIEDIRGVAVNSQTIKTLEERGWVKVVGHRDVPGRPELLATTAKFLDYFGLKSLADLPAVADIMQSVKNVELPLDITNDTQVQQEELDMPEDTNIESTEEIAKEDEQETEKVKIKSISDLARKLNAQDDNVEAKILDKEVESEDNDVECELDFDAEIVELEEF